MLNEISCADGKESFRLFERLSRTKLNDLIDAHDNFKKTKAGIFRSDVENPARLSEFQ